MHLIPGSKPRQQTQTHRLLPDFFSSKPRHTDFRRLLDTDFFRRAAGDACGGMSVTVGGERRRLTQKDG
jgi:hypothetical protein